VPCVTNFCPPKYHQEAVLLKPVPKRITAESAGLTASEIKLQINVFTHADGSHVSKAITRVCVSVFVCPYDKTKTAKTTITKLAVGIVHHKFSLII